jgi:hypothetical protein
MSKSNDLFLDYIMPHVPGCVVDIAKHELVNTLIDFCERTLILQRDLDPTTVVENQIDYDLDAPTGYKVCKIMKAWYLNNEISATAPDMVSAPQVYNQTMTDAPVQSGVPGAYVQKDDATFSLYPVPAETVANAITMRAALKPIRSSTTIEDFIFEDYAEVIAKGTLKRLMLHPAKTYSNNDMAVANNVLYEQGVNSARQRATRGYGRSNLQVKLRRL